jgi:two-component system sensor histidine kinase UhpB
VLIRLERVKGAVVLVVSDDGRGFSVAAVTTAEDRGLGIFGMQERASYVGGSVALTSDIGKGTSVRAVIPR